MLFFYLNPYRTLATDKQMTNPIITETDSYHIQPKDIDASVHLFNSFDHSETETSAGWIIRFLQERGQGWTPFTYDEINSFYAQKFDHGFRFNRLIEPEMVPPSLARAFAGHMDPLIPKGGGWIVKGEDEKYYATQEFIDRCYKSSPSEK